MLLDRHNTAGIIGVDALRIKPVRRAGAETERHDHRIRWQNFFTARDRLRTAAAIVIRLAELGFHYFDANNLAIFTHHFNGLTVKQELHALFSGVGHFLA